MPIWALVSRGMATLSELDQWSVDDIERGLAVIRMRDDVEAQKTEDARKKRDANRS